MIAKKFQLSDLVETKADGVKLKIVSSGGLFLPNTDLIAQGFNGNFYCTYVGSDKGKIFHQDDLILSSPE